MVLLLSLFLIGLSVGSFLNVVIDRLPAKQSIWKGRSHCDYCSHFLSWHDLIPILSYFVLGRKCRWCHKKISRQYPIVEITTGILFLFTYTSIIRIIEVHNLPYLIYLLMILSGLVAIFFTDLKYRIIPDQILVILSCVTLVYLLFFNKGEIMNHIFAALIFFLFFFILVLITRGKGMGLGDVKFAGIMGFILGFPSIVVAFYLSFLTGAAVSLILIIRGKKSMKSTIAFGPFLATSTAISLFYGGFLWNILRRIIGI